jgi:hypothetical protein
MTAVTRSESHTLTPELPASSTEASAAPKSVARSPEQARARNPNQVEPYRGPQQEASSSSRQAPETAARGALTAGQLAFAGPAKADSTAADAAYEKIRGHLRTGLTDWAVTDGDVGRIHEQLERLPPKDYRQVLERMERDGLLEKYVKEMGPEAKRAFLAQAELNGVVSREVVGRVTQAPCNPPPGPMLYRNDPKLPPCVRELVHEQNLETKQGYYDAHAAYVQRYAERIMQAKTLGEIRSLGEPVAPLPVSEPGVSGAHPDVKRFQKSWAQVSSADTRSQAYIAVSHRVADLQGAARPGSLQLKVEAEAKSEFLGVGFKGATGGVLTQDGQVRGEGLKGGVEKALPGGLEGVKVGVEGDSSGSTQGTVEVEARGVQLAADTKGTARVDVPASGAFGAYSEMNGHEGAFGGGATFKYAPGPGSEAKVSVGVSMQGARPERAQDVASREEGPLFGPLPELDQRLPWDAIPRERRERIQRAGWSAEQWTAEIQKRRPSQSGRW